MADDGDDDDDGESHVTVNHASFSFVRLVSFLIIFSSELFNIFRFLCLVYQVLSRVGPIVYLVHGLP